ncbi:hypothetical protein LA080_011068 [Diaporthe eres]|nr:hypothetical protein LA080_011068 [Diaporthe eres]
MSGEMSLGAFVQTVLFHCALILCVFLLLTWRRSSVSASTRKEANISERSPPVHLTLRFRHIPNRINEAAFRRAVGGKEDDSIIGMSWAPSTIGASHVATVCFARNTSFLDKICQKKDQVDCTINLTSDGGAFDVAVDDHFFDLTPLHWPERWDIDRRIVVMCGFATGLGETLPTEAVRLMCSRMAILPLWHVATMMQAYTTTEQTYWNHLQQQGGKGSR